MSNNMIRTTTYYDASLLRQAKKMAIDEGKNLYEVLNQGLRLLIQSTNTASAKGVPQKKPSYRDLVGPPLNLGLKKKIITRADAYE